MYNSIVSGGGYCPMLRSATTDTKIKHMKIIRNNIKMQYTQTHNATIDNQKSVNINRFKIIFNAAVKLPNSAII